MNEQTLVTEFNLAVLDEPPLGFEPDDVVTRAALRHRRRQLSTLVGFSVAAVAAAAVAVPLTLGGPANGSDPGQVQTAKPAAAGPVSGGTRWPNATTIRQPNPTDAQLKATGTAIAAHLRATLPAMKAGTALGPAPIVVTGQFGALELGKVDSATEPGATVRQPMTAPDGAFWVTVDVDAFPASAHAFALGDVCTAAHQQIDPAIACAYARRADGTLVLTTTSSTGRNRALSVTVYRPDGLTVTATTGYDDRQAPGFPLTETQVTDLATDPAFTLAK